MRLNHLTIAGLLLGSASAAAAAPSLAPLFSDHAVLQRGRPIAVWGSAAPGERLSLSLGSASARAVAGRDGSWRAELPPLAAGGPYRLVVTGAGGATAAASDVLVGDVWLCSGQSNMELPLTRALNNDGEIASANDAQLRILTVPKKTSPAPAGEFGRPVSWSPVMPASVPGFSAACYFMARDLRTSEHVPIGAINASWGGTQIRAWMDEASARALGGSEYDLLALFRRDPMAANRSFGTRWENWWRAHRQGEPWRGGQELSWKPFPSISYWEGWGDPAFTDFNGMVWARRKVVLTPAEAEHGATLSLGVIDEMDETWINGVPVGNTFGWDVPREYKLPKGVFHAGENWIVSNLIDAWGNGGFQGPAERLRLTFDDGSVKPLGDGWEYSVVSGAIGDAPRPPWDNNGGLALIQNGMIAPMRDFGLKGVAWYQGESDAGAPADYDVKLSGMIGGWRRQFAAPNLPFLIVSLANYGAFRAEPAENGTAEIREQQRRVAEADPNNGLVVTIDLGERTDIHPANKQEVGHRLARAARAVAYRNVQPAGPRAVAAARSGGAILVRFAGVTGALHSWSGSRALGFELCGATPQSCRFADAVADGSAVRISDDGRPATRVRYAWAESPVVNLYDEAPLPPGPFELPIAR